MAAGQRFCNHIPLGGNHCLPVFLGVGSIQQDIYAQIAGIALQDTGEHFIVIQIQSPPHPTGIQHSGSGTTDGGLKISHHSIADALSKAKD